MLFGAITSLFFLWNSFRYLLEFRRRTSTSHKDDLPPFVVKPQVLGYLNAREAMDCADFFGCEMGDAFLLDYETG